MSFKHFWRVEPLSNFTWANDLAGAWVFYTVLPPLPFIHPGFQRIARFAPLIGVAIGVIQGSLWLLLAHMGWTKEPLALLCIVVGIWITGGLHLDGLMDTADGLAAGENRYLEAMQDSRVGASGVLALTMVLLIQLAALIKLDSFAPVAIPIATFWGRCAPLWAIGKFSYLHQNGSASFHKLHWKKWKEIIPSFLILIIFFILLQSIHIHTINHLYLKIATAIGIMPALIIPDLLGRKLRGHTGDSYGASVVLVETFMFLFLAILL